MKASDSFLGQELSCSFYVRLENATREMAAVRGVCPLNRHNKDGVAKFKMKALYLFSTLPHI